MVEHTCRFLNAALGNHVGDPAAFPEGLICLIC